MGESLHTRDFLTTVTWVVIVAGAVLSIVGYVRSGGGTRSTEYPFDLAVVYSGLILMLGGFVGYAIVLLSSRNKQRNGPSAKDAPPSFSSSES